MEDSSPKEDDPGVLKLLEALKQASHELQAHPTYKSVQSNSSPIKALLELETESDSIISKDPHLSTLSRHLAELKILVETLERNRGYGLRSFFDSSCVDSFHLSSCWLDRVRGSSLDGSWEYR